SEFLVRYWNLKERTPIVGEAMMRDSGIPESDFAAAVARLSSGEAPADVLEDRFLSLYGIAGTPDDCLAVLSRFTYVGVTELVLTFAGKEAMADMARFGQALLAARAA